MTTTTLADKFGEIETSLNGRLIERFTEVDIALRGLVSRQHVLQLGEPGIAKSLLTRNLVAHIDFGDDEAAYFERLLTRTSPPEILFGPLNLAKLEEGSYERNTYRMLPQARIAFLDEIFKAGGSLLNTLLMVVNERIFENPHPEQVPLWTVFAASNEFPVEDELAAISDRFLIRCTVRPIAEPGNFVRMLQLTDDPIDPMISVDEVGQAQTEAAAVHVPEVVLEAMADLRSQLRGKGITPSDRRWRQSLSVIRAGAWLAGEEAASLADLSVLEHTLWVAPDQHSDVKRTVLELANPLEKEAMDLLVDVSGLWEEIDRVRTDDNPETKRRQGMEIHRTLERAERSVEGLAVKADGGRPTPTMNELQSTVNRLRKAVMHDVFDIPTE
jgi:MoxR-like ATPase